MTWIEGTRAFDEACQRIVSWTEQGNISKETATRSLQMLILIFQDCGWDTEDESLDKFKEYDFVVSAFEWYGICLPEKE